jgi:hypothetical protein
MARIRIHGSRTSPVYPNSGLGSKFIAVFGVMELIGRPRPAKARRCRFNPVFASTE